MPNPILRAGREKPCLIIHICRVSKHFVAVPAAAWQQLRAPLRRCHTQASKLVVIFPTETVGLVEVPRCSTLCCFSELQRMATWAGTLQGALSGSFCKIECGISLNIYFRAKFMLRQ